MALILHRLAKNHLDLLPDEALEFARFAEFPLHSRRAHFQAVARSGDHILYVENGSNVLRNKFAIRQGNALRRRKVHGLSGSGRAVDKNAQNPIAAAAYEIHIDNFDALAGANPLRDLDYLVYDSLTVRHLAMPPIRTLRANKKVGLRPLQLFANFL